MEEAYGLEATFSRADANESTSTVYDLENGGHYGQ